MRPLQLSSSVGVAITNPLVLYRTLLATRQIEPDPAQHRLAIHLQKLYYRLKDYSPQVHYGSRLKAISQAIEKKPGNEDERFTIAVPGHPLRRNPLFAHLFARKESSDILSLTTFLTNDEAAINLDSPQGLLLHGEVGSGKSMLLDILADSLPNPKKKRWHFNTFLLNTISRLETLRQSRMGPGNIETEYSLLWLAKDMIETSPILFLDEFQLPDRASSKILSNLLTCFFQLGGVLIASSNRMPDELAKATGVEYALPPRGSMVRNWLGIRANNQELRISDAGNAEFASFLEVLKARCEIWDMGGARDWRRRESEQVKCGHDMESSGTEMIKAFDGSGKIAYKNLRSICGQKTSGEAGIGKDGNDLQDGSEMKNTTMPSNYLLSTVTNKDTWAATIRAALPHETADPIPWETASLSVYGRVVPVPHQHAGVALWTFKELCGGFFGPADYITISSTFHTLILDDVPILTLLQKNEARRLITLLDALYEARCKLTIRADAGPDNLFFPEANQVLPDVDSITAPKMDNNQDSTHAETFSEIYQDQIAPFRPNVTSYAGERTTGYDANEDSSSGPELGQGDRIRRQVDFGSTSAFIGEDERFAYKRASSRLWEMCSSRWHERSKSGWWKPLPSEVRKWERSCAKSLSRAGPSKEILDTSIKGDVQFGRSIELNDHAGLEGKKLEIKKRHS